MVYYVDFGEKELDDMLNNNLDPTDEYARLFNEQGKRYTALSRLEKWRTLILESAEEQLLSKIKEVRKEARKTEFLKKTFKDFG